VDSPLPTERARLLRLVAAQANATRPAGNGSVASIVDHRRVWQRSRELDSRGRNRRRRRPQPAIWLVVGCYSAIADTNADTNADTDSDSGSNTDSDTDTRRRR
jgi:hypothetical protein